MQQIALVAINMDAKYIKKNHICQDCKLLADAVSYHIKYTKMSRMKIFSGNALTFYYI